MNVAPIVSRGRPAAASDLGEGNSSAAFGERGGERSASKDFRVSLAPACRPGSGRCADPHNGRPALAHRGRGLHLRGQTPSYYAKQLAPHAVLRAAAWPILANEIQVA